ncbi:MAG: mevalonate kinase [Nitrosopumilus sp.]|nr:mevalonate kinase [Nitrosopumilus sp.]
MLNNITSISPGKAILFGEHFVVYGYSSIIFAIDKKFRINLNFIRADKNQKQNKINIFSNLGFSAKIVDSKISMPDNLLMYFNIVNNLKNVIEYLINSTGYDIFHNNKRNLNIYINSEIPIGGGLGSSAAFCVSLIACFYYSLNQKIDKTLICEKSIEAEKIINKDTSGIDCTICTFGGLGIYDKLTGFKKLRLDIYDFPFLIIDSGITHDTFEMINQVKKIKENNIELFNNMCQEYERIFSSSITSLKYKNLENLGILMDENHSILKKLCLSNSVIEKIVKICQSGGTFGTKITGSGGGGCILSLIDNDERLHVNRLLKRLDELKLRYFFSKPDEDGVMIEKTNTSTRLDKNI